MSAPGDPLQDAFRDLSGLSGAAELVYASLTLTSSKCAINVHVVLLWTCPFTLNLPQNYVYASITMYALAI